MRVSWLESAFKRASNRTIMPIPAILSRLSVHFDRTIVLLSRIPPLNQEQLLCSGLLDPERSSAPDEANVLSANPNNLRTFVKPCAILGFAKYHSRAFGPFRRAAEREKTSLHRALRGGSRRVAK